MSGELPGDPGEEYPLPVRIQVATLRAHGKCGAVNMSKQLVCTLPAEHEGDHGAVKEGWSNV